MVVERLLLGLPTLPEHFIDATTAVLPLPLFAALLGVFETLAKPLLYVTLLLLLIALGGLGGVWYLRWTDGGSLRRWRAAALLVVGSFLAVEIVLFPIAGVGLFAERSPAGPLPVGGGLLVALSAYALGLATLSAALAMDRGAPDAGPVRRALLRRMVAGVVALGGVVVGASVVPQLGRALSAPARWSARAGSLPPTVTPVGEFYVVSKNFSDPAVDVERWRLRVEGLVERALELRYEDLLDLPAVEQYTTLECISNEVGGPLIGNARWRGVPLRHLLETAGVRSGVRDVVLFAEDGYADSVPLDRALRPEVLIAYTMNGEPLTVSHGFPARLIVPGLYGIKNVKWLSRVELVDHDFQGYWQQRGWTDTGVIKTMSRIDVPAAGFGNVATVPVAEALLGGIAFAGDRGISKVEVSLDGGRTWVEAEVDPALGPYTWVLWRKQWTPPQSGEYHLLVRAYDGRGARQVEAHATPLPDGASGLHTVVLRALA